MSNEFLKKMRDITLERLSKVDIPIDELRSAICGARTPHAFLDIFTASQSYQFPTIIAEIKFASPSLGSIRNDIDPIKIARQYLEHGASALSVLTEPQYFKGSMTYLESIRKEFPQAKLLMKDFIINEYQLLQARIFGADAVLLIVGFLSEAELSTLYQIAIKLGLTPLVEVHTLEELKLAESIKAKLIGVNNRDLNSLKINLSTSTELIKHVTTDAILISESGIKTGRNINIFRKCGYRGFLIGSHFMEYENPGEGLNAMLNEIKYEC